MSPCGRQDRMAAVVLPSPNPTQEDPTSRRGCAAGNFLTAPKFWWALAFFGCPAGLSALELGMSGTTLGLTALTGGMLALIRHFDACEGFPIARRQFIQLAVIVLSSIPVFLVPPLAYVMTYWAAGGSFRFSYRDKDGA
jgi:hypothetical protein